jgi:hypothetical protein
MQFTGHTSTHDLSFTPMQGSAMMNGMIPPMVWSHADSNRAAGDPSTRWQAAGRAKTAGV